MAPHIVLVLGSDSFMLHEAPEIRPHPGLGERPVCSLLSPTSLCGHTKLVDLLAGGHSPCVQCGVIMNGAINICIWVFVWMFSFHPTFLISLTILLILSIFARLLPSTYLLWCRIYSNHVPVFIPLFSYC